MDDLELKWPSGRKLLRSPWIIMIRKSVVDKKVLNRRLSGWKKLFKSGLRRPSKRKKSCIFVGQKWPATRAPSGCYMLPLGSNAHVRPAQGVVAPLCPLATTLGAQQPPAKRFWSIWLPPMGPYIKLPISLGSKTLFNSKSSKLTHSSMLFYTPSLIFLNVTMPTNLTAKICTELSLGGL